MQVQRVKRFLTALVMALALAMLSGVPAAFAIPTAPLVTAITSKATDPSPNDLLSSLALPTVTVTGEAGATLRIYTAGGVEVPETSYSVTEDIGTFTVVFTMSLEDISYYATLTDEGDNESEASNQFTIDTGAPSAEISGPADGAFFRDNEVLAFGSASGYETLTAGLNGDVLASTIDLTNALVVDVNGDGSVDLSGLALEDGTYTLTILATDAAGNQATEFVTFTIDSGAPALSIDFPAADQHFPTSDIDFSGTSEAGSSLVAEINGLNVTFTADLTDDLDTNPDGNWSVNIADLDLEDGTYEITVTATDEAGNTTTQTIVFTIDRVAPELAIATPVDGVLFNTNVVSSNGTVGLDRETFSLGISGGLLASTVDLSTVATVNPDGTWSVDLESLTLADGEYTIEAMATDLAGNPATVTTVFTIDTMIPALSIFEPLNDDILNTGEVLVAGQVEAGSSLTAVIDGIDVTFFADLTAGLVVNLEGTWSVDLTDLALEDGTYEITLTATDAAGNETVETVRFTIDTKAPDVSIVEPAVETTFATTEITVSGTSEVGSSLVADIAGPNDFAADLTELLVVEENGNWTIALAGLDLADGTYVVTVTATDAAGNETLTFIEFTIDTTAPEIAITEPADMSTVTTKLVDVMGTSEPNATINVSLDATLVGTTLTDVEGNWTLEGVQLGEDGAYVFSATATDASDNTSVPFAVTVFLNYDQCASDEDNGCSADAICTNSVNGYTCACNEWFTDVNADGTECVAIELVLDIQSPVDGAHFQNRTPVISGMGTAFATVEVSINNVVLGTVTVDENGQWSLPVVDELADGQYTVVATSSIRGEEATDVVNFTVDNIAPEVAIAEPADESVLQDNPTRLAGTGEPGASLVVFVDGEEVGSVVVDSEGNWELAYGGNLADGEHVVSVEARDAAGNVGEAANSFIIDRSAAVDIVSPANNSRVRTAIPTFTGTGEPGLTVTLTIGEAVVGEVVVDEQGNWTWTATEAIEDGEVTLVAETTSQYGITTTDSVTVTIDTLPGPVTIDSPADGAVTRDATPTFSGTGDPNSAVVIELDGEELATVYTDANGQWNWTPSENLEQGQRTVNAYPVGGDMSLGDTTSVTIDTVAPELTLAVEMADGDSGRATVSGTGEPGTQVEVYVDGELVATVTVGEDGTWSTEVIVDGEGYHRVRGKARDEAGNVKEVEVLFLIDNSFYVSGGGPSCSAAPAQSSGAPGVLGALLVAGLALVGVRRRK